MEKKISIAVLSVILLCSGIVLYTVDVNNRLTYQHNLLVEQHNKLVEEYTLVTEQLTKLMEDYTLAFEQLTKLTEDHNKLVEDYNKLVEDHNKLVEEYARLIQELKSKGTETIVNSGAKIHARIRIWQYKGTPQEVLILDEYHAGVVTDLGDNMTSYKLWGDSDHQYGSLNNSAYTPWISIGNDTGTLASTSTVLPNEWHREVATIDNEAQSYLNFSCTISGADIPGSETADCLGLVFTETDDANDLYAYDTFTEVSGIDSTFTINIDIQVTYAHS